jgi:glycosyltransferase involved in cell wall biosynthesis
MRVLILSEDKREPGKGGGAESLLRDVTAGLRARGHEVEWWFGDTPLAQAIDTFKPDMVQAHTVHNKLGLQPYLYLQRHKIPHVIVLMDYWPFCQGRMLLSDHQRQSCAAVDGLCDGNCDEGRSPALFLETVNRSPVVALNPNTAAIYKRNGINVAAIIGCGIDTDYFKPAPDKREWGKVIATSAWPEYPTKGFHVLKEAAKLAGCEVEVVTHVTREAVRDRLQTASIHVFPSTYEETWGLCLTEAMATGLACIASNVTGPRAQVTDGQNGLLFLNRNAADLAGKLRQLIDEPCEQQRLGQNARAWVEQHATLDVMAGKYERLYKAVLGWQ